MDCVLDFHIRIYLHTHWCLISMHFFLFQVISHRKRASHTIEFLQIFFLLNFKTNSFLKCSKNRTKNFTWKKSSQSCLCWTQNSTNYCATFLKCYSSSSSEQHQCCTSENHTHHDRSHKTWIIMSAFMRHENKFFFCNFGHYFTQKKKKEAQSQSHV